MDRHHDIRELLTDYTLGELPAADRDRVAAHLADCAECALEARELALAFQSIGLAEEPVAPPAHLRERVLANLAAPSPRTAASTRPPQVSRRAPAWLALAASAVLALGVMLALTWQRAGRLDDELRRSHDEIARLTNEAGTVAGQADLAVSILTAIDMRRIDLAGYDVSRDATARAYWSPSRGLLIVADRLPSPPPGRTYQVWLIGSESAGPVSAGLINSARSGRGMLIVPAPRGVQGTVTVAVTDEPLGGLAAPSGSKHLAGS